MKYISAKSARISRVSSHKLTLCNVLEREKESNISGGIYHKLQIDLTYNSNHIEGGRLSYDQTRCIFETNTILASDVAVNTDDIVETANHFKCVDMVIDEAGRQLSEKMIKELHRVLKNGTSDSRKGWFAVGEYKRIPNEVGGRETTLPEKVSDEMKALLRSYNLKKEISLEDILEFHVRFERIHPFQDGNGRIGRLILLKECLKNDIVPFIITDGNKMFYYRGLNEWDNERGYLRDTCLSAQDDFKEIMDYFRISY